MFTSTLLCLLPFLLFITAQNVVVVQVADGGLVYVPNNITAPNGTIVSFNFPNGVGHSVTQGSFASPCVYLPNGFTSGIITSQSQFNLTITDDTTPIWFYCAEAIHCGTGMVGGINTPSTGNTTDAFRAAAIALGASEPAQTNSAPVSSGVGAHVATATSPPSTTSAKASSAKASATSSTTSSANGAIQLSVSASCVLFAGIIAFLSK